jgi:hypothetical protein
MWVDVKQDMGVRSRLCRIATYRRNDEVGRVTGDTKCTLTDDQIKALMRGAPHYVNNGRRFKAGLKKIG